MIQARVLVSGWVWELRLDPERKTAEVVSVTAQREEPRVLPLSGLESHFGQPVNLRTP
jgi:hypothetical protein